MKPNTDNPNMMMNTTLSQLRGLRLETMAQALEQQLSQSGISAMSFEERLALLVDGRCTADRTGAVRVCSKLPSSNTRKRPLKTWTAAAHAVWSAAR